MAIISALFTKLNNYIFNFAKSFVAFIKTRYFATYYIYSLRSAIIERIVAWIKEWKDKGINMLYIKTLYFLNTKI